MFCLKELRLQNKMSQQKLSSHLGVARSTIAMWESGASQPDHATVIKIADLFNVTTDYLLGREGPYSSVPTEETSLFGARLKELRVGAGLSQASLATALSVAQNTVCNWENGSREPNFQTTQRIASFFNVSIDYLMGAVNEPTASASTSSSTPWPSIPILGNVAAGTPAEAVESIIGYEEISPTLAATGEFFALRVDGDSMEPRMKKGDIVIVRKQEDVESGDIAVVLVNGDAATIKRIKKRPEGLMLIPSNPSFEPMFYTNEEINTLPVSIIGKVVELHAKI